jgi:hypothetical protein
MIDYLIDIKPLQDEGVSNANIAAHLSDRTARPMQSESTIYTLEDSGVVLIDPTNGNKYGLLIDYWKGLPEGDEKNLLAFFLSTIYNNQEVNTDQYPRSIQFALAELNMPSNLQLVAQTLVLNAGGRPNMGTTEADVVAIQTQYEQEQQTNNEVSVLSNQYWSLHNQYIAPLEQNKNTNSGDWKAGIQSMADGWVE